MNSERLVRLIVGGVLAIVAALAVAWFLRNFELATTEERSGYSEQALRNPLLAAEHLLRRLGVEATSVSVDDLWRQMPGPRDTLIVYPFQPPMNAERRRLLKRWVESGGHLIVAADSSLRSARQRPGLLTELGVRRVKNENDEEGYATLRIQVPGVAKPLEVDFDGTSSLLDDDDQAALRVPLGDGYGLLQYQVGRGLVTVVSDIGFLHNAQLAQGDSAPLLVYLVGVPNSGKVWLAHGVELPSLLALAWEHLPEAIAAAVVALLLWLWHLGVRLGPMLPPARPARRDIGEHLAATAGFYWRQDRARRLYARNRDRVLQAWLERHFILRQLEADARDVWIAERAGLPVRAVSRALAGEFGSEADFVEMSDCLQRLRSGL